MSKTKSKKSPLTKYCCLASVGIIIGVLFTIVFISPILYASPVDTTDGVCTDTSFHVNVRDTDGHPLTSMHIILYDANLTVLDEGYTDEFGVFVSNKTIFGCGEDSIKLYGEGSNFLDNHFQSEIWVDNTRDAFRDPIAGNLIVTWTINTG